MAGSAGQCSRAGQGGQARRSARTCVAIQEAGARPPLQHRRQLPDQVVGITHPCVHAKCACTGQRTATNARHSAQHCSNTWSMISVAPRAACSQLRRAEPSRPPACHPPTHRMEGRRALHPLPGRLAPAETCWPPAQPSSTAEWCAPAGAAGTSGPQQAKQDHNTRSWHGTPQHCVFDSRCSSRAAGRRACRQAGRQATLTHLHFQVAAARHLAHNVHAAGRREVGARLERREVGYLHQSI